MPTAGEHNCFSELRDELAQIRNQLICAREIELRGRGHPQRKVLERSPLRRPKARAATSYGQRFDTSSSHPGTGSLIFVRIEIDIVLGNLSRRIPYQRRYCCLAIRRSLEPFPPHLSRGSNSHSSREAPCLLYVSDRVRIQLPLRPVLGSTTGRKWRRRLGHEGGGSYIEAWTEWNAKTNNTLELIGSK